MPKIAGGNNSTTGKCWNDTYVCHPVTIGGLDAVIRASAWQDRKHNKGGWNGAAIQARIEYMQRAIRASLVFPENMDRALRTINNLEEQL